MSCSSSLRMCLALVVVGLVTCAVPPALAQFETRTIEHQGVARSSIVVNAAAARLAPLPVMLVLHGRREPNEPNRSSAPLNLLAARERFVAVYPAAMSGAWNWPTRTATQTIPLSMAGNAPADDMSFLTRLIDALIADRIADAARIYVSGASMGGFMTYALMCERSEKIAAAAALIAGMTDKQLAACAPARPVPAMILAGTEDMLVPYQGRTSPDGRLASIPETLAFWWNLHGCSDHAAVRMTPLPEAGAARAISTVRVDSTGCKLDGALRHYRVEGGGHTLPSLRPISDAEAKRFGPRSTEFETSEEVWAFVRRFKL